MCTLQPQECDLVHAKLPTMHTYVSERRHEPYGRLSRLRERCELTYGVPSDLVGL